MNDTARRRVIAGTMAALLLVGALVVVPTHAIAPHRADFTSVLAIYETPTLITEANSFTVAMQLASAANINRTFFTFCLLTSSRCFQPVMMEPHPGGWWIGTTKPMSSYSGMNVGVRAGFNISIIYNDSYADVQYEPALPNVFANLTIGQEVGNVNMFAITVGQFVYPLGGRVVDATTGAGLAGATVAVTPGNVSSTVTNATGSYAFPGLPNGTYNLSVTKTGYGTQKLQVAIAGGSAFQNVQLTASSSTPPPSHPPASANFFTTSLGLGVLALIVIAAITGILLVARQRRRSRGGSPPPTTGSSGGPAT